MLKALSSLWRRAEPVADPAGLRDFLKAEAAFLSQRATIEYCRARAGLNWDKLFKEQAFVEAIEVCRWEAMAAVLADMLVLTEGYLRPHADDAEHLGNRMVALYGEILHSYPEATAARGGWSDLIEAFGLRLARAQLGAPHEPAEVARTAGARVFEVLPIHKSLRTHDREMVVNSIRFGMVSFWQKLCESVREPALLVRRLVDAQPTAPTAEME